MSTITLLDEISFCYDCDDWAVVIHCSDCDKVSDCSIGGCTECGAWE